MTYVLSLSSRRGAGSESGLRVTFSGDELILALVSLVSATNPAMLRRGADGFTVDFESLEKKPELSADELLLLKFRAALESAAAAGSYDLELLGREGLRLAGILERVETLQPWSPDVLEMSRQLRARLAAVK